VRSNGASAFAVGGGGAASTLSDYSDGRENDRQNDHSHGARQPGDHDFFS
jgi:hypothetical protein